jgi:hypothetical protein
MYSPEFINDREKIIGILYRKTLLSVLLLVKADLLLQLSTCARHKARRYSIKHCCNLAK